MKAYWIDRPRFKRADLRYLETVRVVAIRKHTARIEARRVNGTIKRRFIRLERLRLIGAN